ncbi:IQ domain-containing protein C-like isoform X2 [Cyrtonyx montezumae]|uniref:IQ domain-containing protein C-like isoform X2 n=1 Tax=Cyrtonyx montezumae TaxID=9017 RepID=UPI0032DB96FA
MEERRKKRSPRGQPAPGRASQLLPTSKSTSFALPLPTLPSQHARPRRASKERVRAGAARGAPLQHSFLTEVSDVCEMEGGLLGLLSDFHSGKLQAFGKECSFEQLEHVREMQEKLARLHFGLDVCVEELPEEQKKAVADRNLDQLLAHACVRGFLLRRRLRSARAEYEDVVREIEGDLSELRWRGLYLPMPVFVPKPTNGKCSALQGAVSSDKDSTEKTQQELDVSKPEKDWGCSSSMKPTAQLQNKKECNVSSSPDLRPIAGKSSEKRCSAPAQSKEWQNTSSISSVWDSADLEPGSLKACLEIPLVDVKDLPRTRSGLQSFRNHLIMELLWLQQAINSRKNYLKLKQRLQSPDS